MSLRFKGPTLELTFDLFEQNVDDFDIEVGIEDKAEHCSTFFFISKEEAKQVRDWLNDILDD